MPRFDMNLATRPKCVMSVLFVLCVCVCICVCVPTVQGRIGKGGDKKIDRHSILLSDYIWVLMI